jgi:glycosyltransferase involved in cell wall biosynthesis
MAPDLEDQTLVHKVGIVQDCIPRYRWAFFEALYSMGIKENISYVVYSSDPVESDVCEYFKAVHIANREIKLGRITRWHTKLDDLESSDLIVLEQALHNPLLLWKFLLRHPRSVTTFLWGHGGYWTRRNNWLQERVLWYVIRKADHFLAYTDGGMEILRTHSYPIDKITVLRNSIDTQRILKDIKDLSGPEHREWLNKCNISSSHLGCFIGEFRAEKDLPFLILALVQIRSQVSDFEFIYFGGENWISQIEPALI